jgi:hypothetical protein
MHVGKNSRGSESESYEEETVLDELLAYPVFEELFQKLATRTYKPYKKVIKPNLPRGFEINTISDLLKYNKVYIREGVTENTIGYLMTLLDDSRVASIYNDYGIEGTTEVTDMRYPPFMVQFLRHHARTAYDLLWYINNTVGTSPRDSLLTIEEMDMVFSLPEYHLHLLISYAQQYSGPIDKACMLFSLMFGIQLPYIEPNPEYSYPDIGPLEMWVSANKIHGITTNYNNLYGPYLYCSLFPLTDMDRLLFKVKNNNIDSYIQEYAIVVPNNIINKPKYVLEELSRYQMILYRPVDIKFPITLSNKLQLAKEQLAPFTTRELVTYYGIPIVGWENFDGLVQAIINKLYPRRR